MTEKEKEIYFEGENPEDSNYEVIEILRPLADVRSVGCK